MTLASEKKMTAETRLITRRVTATPSVRRAMEKKSEKPMMPTASPAMITPSSTARSGVKGQEMRAMRQHPTALVVTRHIVDRVAPSSSAKEHTAILRQAATSTAQDAGRARFTTLVRNTPSTRARLDSRPSTKPGKPMQKKLISVIWMGWKG